MIFLAKKERNSKINQWVLILQNFHIFLVVKDSINFFIFQILFQKEKMEKPNILLNQSSSDSYYEYGIFFFFSSFYLIIGIEEEDQRKEERKTNVKSKLDELESLNDLRKLSRKEKIIEIQKAKKHFASFFESISKIDQNEFSTYKQELLEHIKGLKDIPTKTTIESIYEQYSSKYYK